MLIRQLESDQREKILTELIERFGFDKKIFEQFSFYKTKDNIYVCAKGAIELAKGIAGVQDLGFAFARLGANVKITTNIVQLIGKFAAKNFISISDRQAKEFISGKDFNLETEQIKNATNGFIIVRLAADNLGVGFLRGLNVKNLLPGAKQLPTFNF